MQIAGYNHIDVEMNIINNEARSDWFNGMYENADCTHRTNHYTDDEQSYAQHQLAGSD